MFRFLWLSLAILIADQVTKWWAVKMLLGRPPIEVLPVFDFSLVYNTGAAFGMLDDAGGWQNTFFIVIAVVVLLFILYSLKRLAAHEIQTAVSLCMILGGALGNVVDRVRQGYVVDFIHWFYQNWHWPHFNIADMAITTGAILLVMETLGWRIIGGPQRKKGTDLFSDEK